MKLREAFEAIALPNLIHTDKTTRAHRHNLSRWERISGDPPIERIDTGTFSDYRRAGRKRGLSPDTIEGDIRTASVTLRMAARFDAIPKAPWSGTPLHKRSSPRWIPTLDELGKCYQNAHVARWPTYMDAATFWRSFYVVALWTGLRRNDLFWRLRWDGITEDAIAVEASKTGRLHLFPVSGVVSRHLATMPHVGETVFAVPHSLKQIRRELDRISDAAGVSPRIQPQSIRRLSITTWEETGGVGRLIHGCGSDVASRNYIALRRPPKQLEDAAQWFRWPPAMLTPEDRDERANLEFRALKILRRMRRADADLWLQTGEKMGA